MGVAVGGIKFILPRWAHLGRQARERHTPHYLEQRHAPRMPAAIPVLLYGHLGDEPFQEHAETINVSASAGLVPVTAKVAEAQELILTNVETNEDLACRVARLVRTEQGKLLAGLEFLQPHPRFWGTRISAVAPAGPGPISASRVRRRDWRQ